MKYIWQCEFWPELTWDSDALLKLSGQARLAQGTFFGRVRHLGLNLGEDAQSDLLVEEAIKTAEIEGERLNRQMVRSSVARHLGLPAGGLVQSTRSIDGLVEVILDATQKSEEPLTDLRLKVWQAALFPAGHSGLHKIRTGQWRGNDPMRIVSGKVGREKIHFEAPPGEVVEAEMRKFLQWWEEGRNTMDGLLRAGLAHFYFVVIHPFEDGNGRIARALTDMALAQDEKSASRYYSLSSQIMEEREEYYAAIEKCSTGKSPDVTSWLSWFLGCFKRSIERSDRIIGNVLARADFWQLHVQAELSVRQKKVLNRMLEAGPGNFEGGLTTRKYTGIAKVSRATAFREISDLLEKGILKQLPGRGRSVSYDLVWPSEGNR
ncbi:MAG: Fic family protein [Candidatus Wallbacteria bacterium]|nr:Fic family protein [Candidatus Wallbacteria bacterium]